MNPWFVFGVGIIAGAVVAWLRSGAWDRLNYCGQAG